MDSERPNRQSIRLKGCDYTKPGWYFVTFNTQGGRPLFGTVVNGRMVLSEAGRIAEEEWRKSGSLRRNLELDEFVIMPNQVHGLVRIIGDGENGGPGEGPEGLDASSPSASSSPSAGPAFGKPVAGALGTFVGAYKAAVSREMRRRGLSLMHQARPWHRNYWDVIVRDEKALEKIRWYIRQNPQNYQVVMQAGEPRCLGGRYLLEQSKVGFLASRGAVTRHGNLSLNQGEVIISGFLSPMERAVFRSGLRRGKPMIWVKPWGLEVGEDSPEVQRAVDEDRLLIVSPFDDMVAVPSARRAAWCNQYVLAHCDRMVIGHLNPEGMLACVLSEADPDLEIVYL